MMIQRSRPALSAPFELVLHAVNMIDALKGMGYAGLAELCNPAILGIINEFHDAPDATKLATLIREIYGDRELLSDGTKRKTILNHLSRSDAAVLCSRLGIALSSTDNPWLKLTSARYTPEKLDALYSAFDLDLDTSIDDKHYEKAFCQTISSSYPLFPHQERAAQEIKKLLSPDVARVLLHMPTGSGKTRTAMSIACDYIRNGLTDRTRSVVVWLADTEELCDQAATEFERAWSSLGIGETNLYRVHGNIQVSLSDISHGFVVIGLQKLNAVSQSQQADYYKLCRNTALVIFDEAHKAIAETYKHAVEVFQTAGRAKLLGLSATPGRSTFDRSENEAFADFFHRKKVSLKVDGYESPIDYLQAQGYLADVTYTDLPYSPEEAGLTARELDELKRGDEPSESLLRRLGLDQKRNLKILSLAMQLAKEHRKTILFSPSVENAEALFALMRYKDIRAGLVTGRTSSDLRRSYITRYKAGELDVLVNYGVLTTGFDAPITSAAIIARPTNSLTLFSQMVGRAIRGERAGGNRRADIYVIKDTLPGLRDMTSTFSHWDESWG